MTEEPLGDTGPAFVTVRGWLKCTHDGVVVALEANIRVVNASAVAVFVAAALRRAVLADKPKVALAHPRGHTRAVHAALCTHRLALAGRAEQQETRTGLNLFDLISMNWSLLYAFRAGTRSLDLTC